MQHELRKYRNTAGCTWLLTLAELHAAGLDELWLAENGWELWELID